MKEVFKIIALIACSVIPSIAQDGQGFLNFVNLIPGDQLCEIRIDSKNPAGEGLKPGEDTGWFMYPVGSASLTITCGDLKEEKGNLSIKEGVGSLVAVYLEADPKPAKDGRPAPPVIKIRSFPTYEVNGRALRFASLCPADNRFQLGTLRIEVKRFESVEIPSWTGAGFIIKKNGKNVAKIPTMREEEPHYLLISEDLEGNHISALVYGGVVKVPPWRQKKKLNEEETP